MWKLSRHSNPSPVKPFAIVLPTLSPMRERTSGCGAIAAMHFSIRVCSIPTQRAIGPSPLHLSIASWNVPRSGSMAKELTKLNMARSHHWSSPLAAEWVQRQTSSSSGLLMLWLLSARRATAKSSAGCAAACLSLLLGLRSGALEDHAPFAAVTSTLCLSTSSRLRLAFLGIRMSSQPV